VVEKDGLTLISHIARYFSGNSVGKAVAERDTQLLHKRYFLTHSKNLHFLSDSRIC